MIASQPQGQDALHMDETSYLVFESKNEQKHEFVDGQVYAMTGASWNHNVICQNVATTLNNQLADSPCVVVANDLRLKVESKNVSFRYPNIMVICDEPQFVEGRDDTILNPSVLVEVLSPSSVVVDHNVKLDEYTSINSVQEYIMIAQDEAKIERFQRQVTGGWLYSNVKGLDQIITLSSINCQINLETIYNKIILKR